MRNEFERILSPVSLDAFFEESYERKPLHLSGRKVEEVFPGLPDIDKFEELLWSHEYKLRRSLRVNRQGKYLQPPPDSTGKDLFRWAVDAFGEGYTLILNGTDTLSEDIARLARAIESETGGKVAANAFLTPPDNHGFNPHFDTHDVFILQLEGAKVWRLFDERINLPVDRQIFLIDQNTLNEPTLEVELQPGDLLYVPRGTVHGAFTKCGPSLHLTVGYRPLRWSDYLKALVEVCVESDAELRRSIRPTSLLGDQRQVLSQLASITNHAKSSRIRRLALERFNEGLVGQLRPLPGGHIRTRLAADEVTADTKVKRREGSLCHVYETGDFVRIQFPGAGLVAEADLQPGSLQAPLAAAGSFRYVANSDTSFTAKNLPDGLSLDSRVAIVRRLVQEGLLIISNGDA